MFLYYFVFTFLYYNLLFLWTSLNPGEKNVFDCWFDIFVAVIGLISVSCFLFFLINLRYVYVPDSVSFFQFLIVNTFIFLLNDDINLIIDFRWCESTDFVTTVCMFLSYQERRISSLPLLYNFIFKRFCYLNDHDIL